MAPLQLSVSFAVFHCSSVSNQMWSLLQPRLQLQWWHFCPSTVPNLSCHITLLFILHNHYRMGDSWTSSLQWDMHPRPHLAIVTMCWSCRYTHDLSSYLINHRRLLAKMLYIHNTKVFLPQNHSNTYYNFPDSLGVSNSESSQARHHYLHWSQHCLWSFHNSSFSSEHFQQTMTFSASPPSKGKQNKTIPTYPCPS